MAGNYDFNVEQGTIDKRRKMAEALQMSALQPMQMPQQPGVKASWLQALLPVLQAVVGQKMSDSASADQSALTDRYKKELVGGMEQFQKTSEGYNNTVPAQGPMPDGSAMEGTAQEFGAAPDRRKALLDALASNHPVLQEMAMQELRKEKPTAQGLTAKDLAQYAKPKDVLANPNDPSTWTPKSTIKDVGGVLYDEDTLEAKALGGAKPAQKTVNGDLYELNPSTGQWKKLDNAPKVSVSTSVNPVIAGQKEGLKEYWQGAGKKVNALGEIANQAQNNMQTLAEMRNLDSQGIFSNTPTGVATFLSNLGQAAGVDVDTKKLGNTETYNALATDLWQGLVSKYGGNRGVTKEEALEIKKMLPLAANSPEARQNLFAILENVSKRQVMQYKAANKSFANAVKMDDPALFSEEFQDVFTPEPNTPAPITKPGKSGGVMSLDEYLKSKGR